jgi:hypothetical protein
VYDLAPAGDPPSDPTVEHAERHGVRLGTVLTDREGRFALTLRSGEGTPPEAALFLVVRGPDGAAEQPDGAILYASPSVRRTRADIEEFLVSIDAAALVAAKLSPPVGSSPPALEQPEAVMHAARERLDRTALLERELRAIAARRVDDQRDRAAVEKAFRPLLLGQIEGPSGSASRFVAIDAPYEEVREAARGAVTSANRPKPPAVGFVQVPEDAVPPEFPNANAAPEEVAAAVVEPLLFGAAEGFRATERVREDPVALARERAANKGKLDEALEPPDDGEQDEGEQDEGAAGSEDDAAASDGAPSSPAASPPVVTTEDLPAFVHRLIDGMAPPDAPPSEKRPERSEVEGDTQTFELNGGPADVPAVYDFHNLQIAFDHVWSRALDEDVLRVGDELCKALADAGGDPVAAVDAGAPPLAALRAETRLVSRAREPRIVAEEQPPVPAVMARKKSTGNVLGGGPIVAGEVVGDWGIPDPDPLPPPPPKPPWPPRVVVGPVNVGGVFEDPGRGKHPHELLDELEGLLQEPYKFEVFAPGSVNYGLDVMYRQRWEKLAYQVGELVKTITLTPKESRKLSTKRVHRKERVVREMENSLSVRKQESSQQARDEAEIVRKAQAKTTFSLTADGSYNIGIAKGDSKASFTKDAGEDSSDTKKALRESVLKAAQEFKDEHKLEVETKEAEELETTESVEITNPNDELTVSYLFYELQRRFRVSEHLHRITPVVLVGMEVPNPSRGAINRVLLTHSWIINRVLLDDRYRPALTYLTTTIVGDELALRERADTVARLRAIVANLERNHTALVAEVKLRNEGLERAMAKRATVTASQDTESWLESAWEKVVGEGDDQSLEAVRIAEENAKAHYEKAVQAEQELRESLRSETAALNQATSEYAEAVAEHSNRLLEVAALRVHFKANVLYYMQAIWSHTFHDQTFFSLHKLVAPAVQASNVQYMVERVEAPPAHVVPKPGHVAFKVTVSPTFEAGAPAAEQTLAEIADLDTPLGFKGNYMIFPLKRSNALTDFMMTPYVDDELGVHDPDELGSWTPQSFVEHVKSLRDALDDAEKFDLLLPRLKEQYRRIVAAPRRPEDEIVVPSESLYVEALPGKHPNLEDFKLRHRAADVSKARAEVRRIELENLRYAGRVLAGERGDPEIDKHISIQGDGPIVVPPEA